MNSSPPIDRPHLAWFAVLDGGLVALAALVLSPRRAAAVRRRIRIPSDQSLRMILVAALLVHLGEAVGASVLARRRGLDGRRWALQTLVVGFPSLRLLVRRPITNGAKSPTITDN